MEPDFGPFPDCESAREWLLKRLERRVEQGVEQRGRFVQASSIIKSLTPQAVARRVKFQRLRDSTRVSVRGYDTSLPDTDILNAIAKHFSSCGEILKIQINPLNPLRSTVFINFLGEDFSKEKAEQLNGSDLGGCKLDVKVQPSIRELSAVVGKRMRFACYVLPESVRRELALKEEEAKRARREEEETKLSSQMKKTKLSLDNEAL